MHESSSEPAATKAPSSESVGDSPREQFIPLRKADLVRLLADDKDLPAAQRDAFLKLCELLDATFHFEYHKRLEELKNAYALFDPDADTVPCSACETTKQRQADILFKKFIELLARANYVHLSRAELEAALDVASDSGVNLDVDFDVFDRLEVFARGETQQERTVRHWRNFWRPRTVQIATYRRLVLIFRTREHKRLNRRVAADTVYIKIFKEIPKADLEMLLPGTKVKMTLFDQSRILLPAVSGVAVTIYKIIKGALMLAFAGIYGILAFLGLLGGTFGYALKSFMGYLRARDKYRLNLTQHLYYQNLDNNAGVFFRMLDEAEEQEVREAVLAYFLLWQKAKGTGWSVETLDRQAERYLREAAGVDVDFEVDDALEKLLRLGLVQKTGDGGLQPVPIDNALERLDHAWDNYFDYNAQRVLPQKSAERAA